MIKLAVISDIHGNYKALEVFLAYCEEHPVDGIICLGDYVTDSPYPERTMELIYQMQEKYTCYMIRGNRENYLLDNAQKDMGWKPSSSNGSLYYTAMHLTEKDMQFFASLPEERELALEGYPVLMLCHGTPGEVRGNVTMDEGLRDRALQAVKGDYLLGGHSHHQEIYQSNKKTYLNPGSLGLAIDGVGRQAQFAIITGEKDLIGKWTMELISILYDVDSFLNDFSESGLDEYGMVLNRAVKKTLVTGINYFFKSVQEAEKEGKCPIADVPECIWEKVAERLEL